MCTFEHELFQVQSSKINIFVFNRKILVCQKSDRSTGTKIQVAKGCLPCTKRGDNAPGKATEASRHIIKVNLVTISL